MSIAGKTAIIVDDGAATGTTLKIAIRAIKRRSPREIIVAVPVSPQETVAELACEADRVVCLSQPGQFRALSYHYMRFPQLSDSDVVAVIGEAGRSQTDRQHLSGQHAAGSKVATKTMPRNNREK
ncbi:phosphoribosyltransferase family protein [Mesorhizobium sp. M7A.F.Ca.CA.001.12.2.1]|uniref:phosphoribosyltransferase family protein n=1 Tax=Mesorhizobium sp. M7A.F.Ca.CA.001.12.2.1 TaxID=2496725 RepID=UPI0032AEFE1E